MNICMFFEFQLSAIIIGLKMASQNKANTDFYLAENSQIVIRSYHLVQVEIADQ